MLSKEKFNKDSLISDLKELGLKEGDTVLIRGDLGKIGRVEGGAAQTILSAFLETVGPQGTIMGLSFTEQFFIFSIDKNYVFDKDTPSKSGALAKIMLAYPGALRSSHPINSFVAIGKNAEYLLSGHDEREHGYLPIEKLLELDGKMMIFGCIANSPGFTTVHLAQEKLGLAYKTPFRNLFGAYYMRDGKKQLFKRKSIGGCSMGFAKFYSDYICHEKLKIGKFGNAYSLIIEAKSAYQIEYEKLGAEPRYALCLDASCPLCRGMWFYNFKDMPFFYIKNSLKLFKKVFLRK